MPKLGVFSGADVCRILESEGFTAVRQRGSHIVMQRAAATGTTTVPVPNHRSIRLGTLQSIIRQSGVPREKFLR
jgi:predicted RNA binding protein YcfA (HicA-like mRNA interferase family)